MDENGRSEVGIVCGTNIDLEVSRAYCNFANAFSPVFPQLLPALLPHLLLVPELLPAKT